MSDALKLHSQPLWDVLAVISLLTKCLSHKFVAECLFLSALLYWYAVYLARYWKRQQQMDGLVCGRVLSTCFCWHLIMIRSKCVYLSASKGKKARGMKKEMMLTSMGRTRRKTQKVQWFANQLKPDVSLQLWFNIWPNTKPIFTWHKHACWEIWSQNYSSK